MPMITEIADHQIHHFFGDFLMIKTLPSFAFLHQGPRTLGPERTSLVFKRCKAFTANSAMTWDWNCPIIDVLYIVKHSETYWNYLYAIFDMQHMWLTSSQKLLDVLKNIQHWKDVHVINCVYRLGPVCSAARHVWSLLNMFEHICLYTALHTSAGSIYIYIYIGYLIPPHISFKSQRVLSHPYC